MTVMAKPLPTPVAWDEPFWMHAKAGRLSVQECRSCHRLQFYPRPVCANCLGREFSWLPVSGDGHVHSFTFVRVPDSASFKDEVPILLVEVELNEGVRMLSRLIGCEPDEVTLGTAVRVRFDATEDESILLPHFELRRQG